MVEEEVGVEGVSWRYKDNLIEVVLHLRLDIIAADCQMGLKLGQV